MPSTPPPGCPWVTEKLRPGQREVARVRAQGGGCPQVSGLGQGCCAPAPAALTTSLAPSRPQTARSLKAGSPPALPESLLLTCIDVIASLGFPWKHWLAQNSNTLIQAGGAGETVCNPAANSARERAQQPPPLPRAAPAAFTYYFENKGRQIIESPRERESAGDAETLSTCTRRHPRTRTRVRATLGLPTLEWAGPAFKLFHGPAVLCARVRVPRIGSSQSLTFYWVWRINFLTPPATPYRRLVYTPFFSTRVQRMPGARSRDTLPFLLQLCSAL